MVRSRELDGDALASDVDGFDANGARLADAIERVGIYLGVGVGVGAFAHRGDVQEGIAADAEIEEAAERDDVADDGVFDFGARL